MSEDRSVAERVAAVEAQIEAQQSQFPTIQSVIRLGQILTLVFAAIGAAVGIVGVRSFSDIESYAKRQVDAAIPGAEEAKTRFSELKAQSERYEAVLEEVQETADLLSQYRDSLSEMPSPQGLVNKALSAAAAGNHDIAVGFLRQLLDSDQANAPAYQMASQIAAQQLGLNSLSRAFARRAYELIPTDPEIEGDYLQLTAENPQQIEATIARFRELTDAHPMSDRLWQSVGNFYSTVVNWKGLRELSESAIGRASEMADGRPMLSPVAFQLRAWSGHNLFEDPEITRPFWVQAFQLTEGKDSNVLKQYGSFLVRVNECESMNEMFETSIPRIFERQGDAEIAWAMLNIQCGDFERGCEIGAKAIATSPVERGAINLLANGCGAIAPDEALTQDSELEALGEMIEMLKVLEGEGGPPVLLGTD